MAVTYKEAPEVKEVADKLIPKYHQHLLDFNVRVDYLFIDKIPMKGGKEVWGSCRKITNLNAYLAKDKQSGGDPFFVITIAQPVWDVLPPNDREALVDHELCHASAEATTKDDEDVVKLSINPHDMEEFAAIVRRHGMWRDSIEEFVKAARQVGDIGEDDIEDEDAE